MSYILNIKGKDHPFNNSRVLYPYWGDYSYIRLFNIIPENVTGWIVQLVKRETVAHDLKSNIYNTNKKIYQLTNNVVSNSNESYIELFKVYNGNTVDHNNKNIIIDDEFGGAAIKPYIIVGDEIIVDNNKQKNTYGYSTMKSKAYMIPFNKKINDYIYNILDINMDVSSANGLLSSYDIEIYNELKMYQISNEKYCELKVSWDAVNGKNKLDVLTEF